MATMMMTMTAATMTIMMIDPITVLVVFRIPGNCSDVEMGAYLDAGFDAVLRKPFSITEIKAIMDKLIPPSTQAG